MEAIVLAGGFGTRLRSVVSDVPKPMAPVRGVPFLSIVLDQLVDQGFTHAILAVGYRSEAISSFFGQRYRGLVLTYSVEEEPLGTGGAIRLACARSHARDVFVLNGDTFLELDYGRMLSAHIDAAAQLSIAVCFVPDLSRYGALTLSGEIVQQFAEKGVDGPGWINGGTYILGPAMRARLAPSGAFSFERDLMMPGVGNIRPTAFRTSGAFIDIGIPEDYARAQDLLLQRSPR